MTWPGRPAVVVSGAERPHQPAEPGGSPALDAPALEGLSFEQLMELLEDLTRRMADGEVGIEEAAELYERAGTVYRAASERLARVQARLSGLSREPGTSGPPDGGEAAPPVGLEGEGESPKA